MSSAGTQVEDARNQQFTSAECVNDTPSLPSNVPTWLNKKFIASILQRHFGEKSSEVRIERLDINSLGGNGESYASMMFRVVVHFASTNQRQAMNVVVKTLPLFEMALEKLGSGNYNVQNKEMEMYQRLLPEMKALLVKAGECPNFAPVCYGIEKKFDVIILEDLSESNYVVADRLKQLNSAHTMLGLQKLARFHAAGAFMYQQNPSRFDLFKSGFFTRKTDAFHVMFESLCDAFVDEIATWQGFEYYALKMRKVRKNLVKCGQRAFDCDADDFLVLNHGDLWTTNIMFNYDENGRPIDAKLIDFQFSHIGSPALDLIYFLFSSTTDDLRQHKIEELIHFYYNELKALLARMSFDMEKFPSLHAFQLQVRKKYFYVVTTSLLILPVHLSEDKDASFESLQCTDERSMGFKRRVMQNPKYQAVAKKMLPMLDRRGLLDDML